VFQSFDLEVKFQNGAYQFLWTLTNISSLDEYILVYKINHFLEKDVLYCFGFFAKKIFDERVFNSGFDKVVIADNQVGNGGGLAIGV